MNQDSKNTNAGATSTSSAGTSTDVGQAKDALVEGAHHLTSEMKHAAGDAAEQVKHAAEHKLDAGRDFAAEHLGSVADALRKTGDALRAQESGLTNYVTKAATSVDYASLYLQTRTLSQLMGDLQGFARREPAMFLGGSFLAGLVGGRFLKSASPQVGSGRGGRQETAQAPSGYRLPAYTGQPGAQRQVGSDDGHKPSAQSNIGSMGPSTGGSSSSSSGMASASNKTSPSGGGGRKPEASPTRGSEKDGSTTSPGGR